MYTNTDRCVIIAKHIIKTGDTVREAAKKFGISKSTVHKDVTERLIKVNKSLSKQVKKILEKNKSERHIRGGLATKNKYLNKKQNLQKYHGYDIIFASEY